MAEGTPGLSAVQVLPTELKTPSSSRNPTAAYVDQGVSDVTNRNTLVRHNSNNQQQQHRSMTMEGNPNNSGMAYHNNSNTYNNAYNQYSNNNVYNNNQYFNQYNNNNYYGGGGYNSYNRDYNYSNNTFSKPATFNPPPPASETDDGSTVDSALLAALRDSRERVALLRLEQVMIDFMNAPEGYLEVGGPYNSVVVSPNTSNKRFQSAASVAGQDMGRQTSFQRCLLHRLADRFGIVRETGTILEGSIRLIKQKDSRIPKVLLLDHIEKDSNNNAGNNKGGGDGTEGVAAGMDNLQVSGQGAAAPAPAKDKSKRKMKIMKRNSSSETGNGQAKSTPRSRKNKNFSDKEKAYAEARARIFADEAAAANVTHSAPPSMAPSPSATPPPAPTSANSTTSNCNNNTTTSVATPVHKSASTSNLPRRMSSNSLTSSDVNSSSFNEQDGGDRPAAASSGVSKATWRNRKEEENDPDFQRGAGLQTLAMPVAAAPATAFGAPNAYHYAYPQGAAAPYGQATYYGEHYNPGRGGAGGRGAGGGRGFVSTRGYGYPQQQQHYRMAGNNGGANNTNVNCMEEFPALG